MTEPILCNDYVECVECGAEIVHLIVAGTTPWRNDPNYKLCIKCEDEWDAANARSIGIGQQVGPGAARKAGGK
jgi:hypothetical protein